MSLVSGPGNVHALIGGYGYDVRVEGLCIVNPPEGRDPAVCLISTNK